MQKTTTSDDFTGDCTLSQISAKSGQSGRISGAYIEEIRDDFKDLDYIKSSHTLKIEDAPQSFALSLTKSQPASA